MDGNHLQVPAAAGRFISDAVISDKLRCKSNFWEKGSFWLTVLSKSPPSGAVETEN